MVKNEMKAEAWLKKKEISLKAAISRDKIAMDHLAQKDSRWNSLQLRIQGREKVAQKQQTEKVAGELAAEKALRDKLKAAINSIKVSKKREAEVTRAYKKDWYKAASATRDYTDEQGAHMAHQKTLKVKQDFEQIADLRTQQNNSAMSIMSIKKQLTRLRHLNALDQQKAREMAEIVADRRDAAKLGIDERKLAKVTKEMFKYKQKVAKYENVIRFSEQNDAVPDRGALPYGMNSNPMHSMNAPSGWSPIDSLRAHISGLGGMQINDIGVPTPLPTYTTWTTLAPGALPTLSPTGHAWEIHSTNAPTPKSTHSSLLAVNHRAHVTSFFCVFPAFKCHVMHSGDGEYATEKACTAGCKPHVVSPTCETYVIKNCGDKLQGSHEACAQCIQDVAGGPLSRSKLQPGILQAAMESEACPTAITDLLSHFCGLTPVGIPPSAPPSHASVSSAQDQDDDERFFHHANTPAPTVPAPAATDDDERFFVSKSPAH
jgi:hypothetical protein